MPRRRLWLGLGLTLALGSQACTSRSAPARQRSVQVVPARLDLGVLTQNQPARATVELRSPSPLRLSSTASSTRCRWQDLPDLLAADARTSLTVICQSDLLGPLQEQLLLLEGSQVVATVQVVGKVEPLIGFDTAFVDLRPEFGQVQSADIHLVGPRAHQATPRVTSTGGTMVTVTPLATNAGRPPGFRVSCQGSKVGMHAGSLVVDTGQAEQPSLTLSWGCRVPGTLQVEPSNPTFNLHVSGDRATTILVRSSHPGFAVKSAQITEGPFRATLEKPNPDGSFPITVRVDNREIPDEARSAAGKLLIQSNDPREPSKEIPLLGFGKINKVPPN